MAEGVSLVFTYDVAREVIVEEVGSKLVGWHQS